MGDSGPQFTSLTPDNRPEPRTAFDHALNRFLDDAFEASPIWATRIGFHAFDDRWPDPSEAGRSGRLAMLRHHRARLEALPEAELTPSERIDRGITLEAIDASEFEEAELRESSWDPLSYVYSAGSGLFNILAREYGPWQHRGTAFLGRVRGLPQLLEAGAAALTGFPGRPVSLLHTQTALAQLGGVNDLIDQGLVAAERRAAEPEASADDRSIASALAREANAAKSAVEQFGRRLREDIAPRAEGEGRLGPDLFQQKLRHTLASDLPYAELAERAQSDYGLVRDEMLRLAKDAWNDWQPAQAVPPEADETIRRVLDAVALEHRQPNELLDASEAEVRRIEEFCRDRGVIGLPDEPLEVTWTPVFMRAYGGAFLDSPGPLDKGQSSYFWITPPDESKGPQAVESYLREENDRMLRLLAIHEGVPGHYLQLAWANRTPSLARGVFGSGMFAEGWAVYVTQVMMDIGYGDFEPALLLNHWKFYLRAITNALMDVAIHTQGMTEAEAMDLMVAGGFQEEDEARRKWLRARLTATQLSTYYLGSMEMWDMEVEARRRAAIGASGSADSVPPQRIAGGLGETPGFDYRAHLESVISHGMPPIKWVSRILFG
ncbi:MAG: DUF885 domain-containing protein [Chloroflexota bacterium]